MSRVVWPLFLLALALFLLIAEVFVPSGGLIGLVALGCLVLSLWQAFSHSYELGLRFLLADFLLLPLCAMLAVYLWPKTPLARRATLKPPAPGEDGPALDERGLHRLVGLSGRAVSALRPSGVVEFEGRRENGLAEEGWIEAGAAVRAVRARAGEIVVRLLPEAGGCPHD